MRTRVRGVVIAMVGVLLCGVGVLVGRSLWQQHQRELLQMGLAALLPGVSQHIQDFRRVKMKDGRKVWEVAAQDAQYFEGEQTVVVRGATVQWYRDDGRRIGLRGAEGRILLDGRDVVRIELNGEIEVNLADYVVQTDRAVYDHSRERIEAPGAVAISGRALQLSGDGMEVDVDTQRLRLLRNVSMVLEPALLEHGTRDAPL